KRKFPNCRPDWDRRPRPRPPYRRSDWSEQNSWRLMPVRPKALPLKQWRHRHNFWNSFQPLLKTALHRVRTLSEAILYESEFPFLEYRPRPIYTQLRWLGRSVRASIPSRSRFDDARLRLRRQNESGGTTFIHSSLERAQH